MAFDLLNNNLSGVAVITDANSTPRQLPENFIGDSYTYLMKYQPELIPDLAYVNGKGSILGFIRATTLGKDSFFESDSIQHSEMNRLHDALSCTATNNSFVSDTPHKLEVRDVVKISDGETEYQGTVSAVASSTAFTVLSDKTAFTFTAAELTVIKISNRSKKGDDPMTLAKKWDPTVYKNRPQIIKSYYETSDSDLAHATWIQAPNGEKGWYKLELDRMFTEHDNLTEMTLVLHEQALADSPSVTGGFDQGLKSVVQQVEERGNISNDYITTLQDLSNLAKRAKQQGTCREFTIWCDHDQMAFLRILSAGLNSSYVNGSHYGAFNNKKDMALNLDFVSLFVDGVQFHFASWLLLDDPTLLDAVNFDSTSLAYLMVPSGNTYVQENGNTVSRSYITVRYRGNEMVNRRRQIKWFGCLGQQTLKDSSGCELLTEATIQVVGANNYFVGRKSNFYSV